MTTEVTPSLAEALVRLSHTVQHVFADVSREYGLTPQQAHALCRLVAGPVGMTELSRALHLEKSSLTGLVDRIEQRELVVRVRDGADRRACRIELTPVGNRLAWQTHEEVTRRLDEKLGALREPDRKRLTSAVMRVIG